MGQSICRFFAAMWVMTATAWAQSHEYRAFSLDAWNNDFNTSSKCAKVIDDLRSANVNTLFVEVRRRGDAFYNSKFEPKNPVVAEDFDPLADLLGKAHDTSGGKQRMEIHAWIVMYHIWKGSRPPSQASHPLVLHPDWLLKDIDGKTYIENQYTFDPGHPEVQRHTFNVCMDLVENYNIDGLNFDYVRYSGVTEGYNDVTVARFNKLFGRTGIPTPYDPVWKQFRRDQITALVRKIYLCAAAINPKVKISADTITWNPGPTTTLEWTNTSAAYTKVLQDWRSWMEEGILDINMPMNYFREADSRFAADYRNWSDFATDNKFNRHAIINAGIYLNSVSNGLVQMRYPRKATARGNKPEGMAGYDYRKTNKDGVSNLEFFKALTSPSAYDPIEPALFAKRAEIPEMPWKTRPTKGHLKGFVLGGTSSNYLDGADITISGPVNRKFISDATGFFGSVDLPPGEYALNASFAGHHSLKTNFTIKPGVVTDRDLYLNASPQERTVAKKSDATTVPEVILDNSHAIFSSSWASGTMSPDKYGPDYLYVKGTVGEATATMTYRPVIPVSGKYDVFVWFPQGSNRATNAPWTISCNGETTTVIVNQTNQGGGWVSIADDKEFVAGTNGFVRLSNGIGNTNKIVLADAVRFVYVDRVSQSKK